MTVFDVEAEFAGSSLTERKAINKFVLSVECNMLASLETFKMCGRRCLLGMVTGRSQKDDGVPDFFV